MTFEKLLAQRKVAAEPTDRDEIQRLRLIARRYAADSSIEELSMDGRFERAYGAARTLATIVVRAAGYRVRWPGSHYNTFLALEAAQSQVFSSYAAYFAACRNLRNELSYEAADVNSELELKEILEKVPELSAVVEEWLVEHYPELVPQ